MGKLAIGALAFAAGAALGGLFVGYYVKKHYAGLAGEQIGEKVFGAGSTGAKIVAGIFDAVDTVRS